MDRAAKLISLAAGYMKLIADTVAQIGTVLSASRCAHIACGDNLVLVDDYCTVTAAQTGTALGYCVCDVKLVVGFISALHGMTSEIKICYI